MSTKEYIKMALQDATTTEMINMSCDESVKLATDGKFEEKKDFVLWAIQMIFYLKDVGDEHSKFMSYCINRQLNAFLKATKNFDELKDICPLED